ncbi:hypothetical protein GDO81_023688 [Engystomops pustulosus]|uniref:Uncharacterized protein n=1 Tax=Engystomops pustulosus TaxID=76066 RepID=A0AAV6YSH0_ENGPU|nr:hypothetical protein GDO81_023688 [Engystomops pustulosus]
MDAASLIYKLKWKISTSNAFQTSSLCHNVASSAVGYMGSCCYHLQTLSLCHPAGTCCYCCHLYTTSLCHSVAYHVAATSTPLTLCCWCHLWSSLL